MLGFPLPGLYLRLGKRRYSKVLGLGVREKSLRHKYPHHSRAIFGRLATDLRLTEKFFEYVILKRFLKVIFFPGTHNVDLVFQRNHKLFNGKSAAPRQRTALRSAQNRFGKLLLYFAAGRRETFELVNFLRRLHLAPRNKA